MNIGCKVLVSGHVQFVGFRYFTRIEALKRGLTGHAKNLTYGDVEVVLYGQAEKITEMLNWLDVGPKTAQVDKTIKTEIDYQNKSEFLTL